jgi:hypothetical protein
VRYNLKKVDLMDTSFLKVVNDCPELLNLTKQNDKSLICHGVLTDKIIESVSWWYKNYFSKETVVFLPKNTDLEALENVKPSNETVIIFGFADIIFNDLCKNNKRRFNTILKRFKKSKVIILSNTNLKCLDLNALDTFEEFALTPINFHNFLDTISLIDLLDPEIENYQSNVESFIEIINELASDNKRIYISLNLTQQRIAHIFTKLKELDLVVSKVDDPDSQIVINSSKTTEKLFLKNEYSIYIYILPHIEHPLDLISYIKNFNSEIYLDSSKINNVSNCLKKITNSDNIRINIKDSQDFDKYSDIKFDENECLIVASENYYSFQAPESIQKLNLSNLTKKDYDLIRNCVKIKLINKFDLEIKTCQLASPSSPKDRSRKLNSLSNKLSSFDYRCDITCEIFKDYTIGVVIWNETFANRKALNLNVLKNNIFVYQTTYGKWKYTSIK